MKLILCDERASTFFISYLRSPPSQVKSSKSEGRYMVAKQKILPGDVLVVEPAFSTSLFRDFYSTNCLHCFQRLPEEPVCCPGCTTVSSYCLRTLEKVSSLDVRVALYVKTSKTSCITVGRVAHDYHTVSRSGAKSHSPHPQIFRC